MLVALVDTQTTMIGRVFHVIGSIVTALPGWMLLVSGLVLVGLAVIIPLTDQQRELDWQRNVMRMQAQQFHRQSQAYSAFLEALHAGDPAALERYAYYNLNLRPVGARSALPEQTHTVGLPVSMGPGAQGSNALMLHSSIDEALMVRIPRVGEDIHRPRALDTRLLRLTRGHKRLVILGVGVICLWVGLWPESAARKEDDEELVTDEEVDEESDDLADDEQAFRDDDDDESWDDDEEDEDEEDEDDDGWGDEDWDDDDEEEEDDEGWGEDDWTSEDDCDI